MLFSLHLLFQLLLLLLLLILILILFGENIYDALNSSQTELCRNKQGRQKIDRLHDKAFMDVLTIILKIGLRSELKDSKNLKVKKWKIRMESWALEHLIAEATILTPGWEYCITNIWKGLHWNATRHGAVRFLSVLGLYFKRSLGGGINTYIFSSITFHWVILDYTFPQITKPEI